MFRAPRGRTPALGSGLGVYRRDRAIQTAYIRNTCAPGTPRPGARRPGVPRPVSHLTAAAAAPPRDRCLRLSKAINPKNEITFRSEPSHWHSKVSRGGQGAHTAGDPRRTRLFGGGVLALGIAAIADRLIEQTVFPLSYAAIISMAAIMMYLSSIVFTSMGEPATSSAPSAAKPGFFVYLKDGFAVMRNDRTFRLFVYAQWCGGAVLMAMPFYIVQANALGLGLQDVAILLAAQTAGALASNLPWGWWGDTWGKVSLLRAIAFGRTAPPAVMLALAACLSLVCGTYLWFHARRDPGDDPVREDGMYLPHASIWPFWIGVAAFLMTNGLVLGIWFLVPGTLVMIAGLVGFIRQSRARSETLLAEVEQRLAPAFRAARDRREIDPAADPARLARRMQSDLIAARVLAERDEGAARLRERGEEIVAWLDGLRQGGPQAG